MAYNPFHKNAYLGNGQYDQLEVLRKSKDPLINYEGLYEDAPYNIATSNIFKAMQPEFEYRNPRFLEHAERKGMVDLAGNVPMDRDRRIDFARYWSDSPLYSRRSKARFEDFSPRVGQPLGYQEAEADQEIDIDSLTDPFANNIFEQNETISTPNITVAEELIDEDRIPGRVQESVPNYQNWFERMKSGVQDKFSNFKMPPLGITGLINAIGNQFEDRQLTGDVMDEYGNMYSADELNKMNALGGYYTDPARSSRRRTSRIANMLARKEAGKKYSKRNLEKLQAQTAAQEKARMAGQVAAAQNASDRQNIQNIQNYTGRSLSDHRMSQPASQRNYTGAGKSGMGRNNPYYADGGIASMFTRRG